MHRIAFIAGLVALAASSATGQTASGPPGPSWKAPLAGKPVFVTPDSITKIGADAFRYVVFRRLGDAESLETVEVHCADRAMRTTRLVTRGKYIVPDKRGNRVSVKDTPNGSFDKPFPGGSVDVLVGKVCDMAHGKFRAGRHR